MWQGLGITGKRCPARSGEKTDGAHVALQFIRRIGRWEALHCQVSSGVVLLHRLGA